PRLHVHGPRPRVDRTAENQPKDRGLLYTSTACPAYFLAPQIHLPLALPKPAMALTCLCYLPLKGNIAMENPHRTIRCRACSWVQYWWSSCGVRFLPLLFSGCR